jgi:RNA polymerase sigma-70 factor (ECF subfamily)
MGEMSAPGTRLPDRLAADLDGVFPEFVRATQDGVFAGALRMTGNRHEAEDVTQEALVRAYRALSGYSPERIRALRLESWVWTIAANLCRNRHRSRRRAQVESLGDRDPDALHGGPEHHALRADRRERLAEHLGRLPWAMRSAVVLHHVVGLAYEEIAEALERPAGTVRSDVHRGLARLRAAIAEEEI